MLNTKCNRFAKILRNGENKEFSLTKEHTYYKNIITPNNIIKNNISKKDWENNNFRIKLFKSYFQKNLFCSVPQCFEYAHRKLGENIIIDENIKSEIQHAKSSIIQHKNIKKV